MTSPLPSLVLDTVTSMLTIATSRRTGSWCKPSCESCVVRCYEVSGFRLSTIMAKSKSSSLWCSVSRPESKSLVGTVVLNPWSMAMSHVSDCVDDGLDWTVLPVWYWLAVWQLCNRLSGDALDVSLGASVPSLQRAQQQAQEIWQSLLKR